MANGKIGTNAFLIFPSTLYRDLHEDLIAANVVYILEEPMFFHDPVRRPYRHGRVKLTFMRAALKEYERYLGSRKDLRNIEIRYIEHNDLIDDSFYRRTLRNAHTQVSWIDPQDRELSDKLFELLSGGGGSSVAAEHRVFSDERMFMVGRDVLEEFHASLGPSPRPRGLSQFYAFVRKRVGIMEGVPSTDRDNRKRLPRDKLSATHEDLIQGSTRGSERVPLPGNSSSGDLISVKGREPAAAYVHAAAYVDAAFPDSLGPRDVGPLARAASVFPCTFAGWKAHLKTFVKKRLTHFADYQDAIAKRRTTIYHSLLAIGLNTGMLLPREVLHEIHDFRAASGKRQGSEGRRQETMMHKIDKNVDKNVEAMVRQILGWREYMRYVYLFYLTDPSEPLPNQLGLSRRLVFRSSYAEDAEDAEDPLRNEVRKVVATGYSHHIVRLMIHLNMLVLAEIRPEDVIRWMTEVYVDALTPMFMVSNVVSMGFYDDRFVRKPYLCGAAYILKMSDYTRSRWFARWNALFHSFLWKHQKALISTPYARNIWRLKRMSVKDRQDIMKLGAKYRASLQRSFYPSREW